MIVLGSAFFIIVVGLFDRKAMASPAAVVASTPAVEMNWKQMIRTPDFWVLWTMYVFGSAAGLMVIGSAASMAKISLGESAFIAVVVLSVGNAGGRILAGMVSDKIGRQWTLFFAFLTQSVMVLVPLFFGHQRLFRFEIIWSQLWRDVHGLGGWWAHIAACRGHDQRCDRQ